jgi:drug/metabolite transporter (DMT)-like permease
MRRASHERETIKKPPYDLLTSVGIWFSTLCWGSAYVAARFLLHPDMQGVVVLQPVMLAALRFSIASLFFVVPLAQGIIRHEITGRHLLLMALLGQLTFSLYYWLQYIGIEQTNASISSILGVGLIPLFTTLIAQVSGAEKKYLPMLGTLILGLVGVALIVFEQPLRVSWQSGFLIGALCLVLNTFFFAVYSNLSKRWMQDIPPVVMTGGTMISGAIGLVLFSFLDSANNQWSEVAFLNVAQWFALLFLAIGCSVLAYFAYNVALSKRDASRVAVYFYFEPVVTIILGVTFLSEHLTWQIVIGAVVIGASVLLVNLMKK